MTNINKRSSRSRIFSFIVLLGLLPAWFFYIGVRYSEAISAIDYSINTNSINNDKIALDKSNQ